MLPQVAAFVRPDARKPRKSLAANEVISVGKKNE
jgi:hypothetical protein